MTERRHTTVVSPKGEEPVYFAWVRGLRGPEPQIWFGDQVNGTDKFKAKAIGDEGSPLIALHRLSPSAALDARIGVLTVKHLARSFPLPDTKPPKEDGPPEPEPVAPKPSPTTPPTLATEEKVNA